MQKTAFLLFFSALLNWASAQTVNITITGIRSTKGNIQLQFFTTSENFDAHKPVFTKTVAKTGMKNGTLTVSYNSIPKGHYGVALLDDENGSGEMDYGIMLPDEGFGFSNYYHKGMSHPKFDQFDFYLTDEPKNLQIKVRYM